MPLTPFHLGPALLLGVVLHRRLDLVSLLVGSVVVDVRAALVVFGPLDPPVHGILTTFAGGAVVAALLAGAVIALQTRAPWILSPVRLADTDDRGSVFAGALAGVWSHVVLDALLYGDARPFFPLEANPFLLGPGRFFDVYVACVLLGLVALPLLGVRIHRHHC